MNFTRTKRRTRLRRTPKAVTLIEILVALLLGALLAGVFLDILGQLMRLGTATQNEISANAIAQEMIETSHSLGYTYLSQHLGTYDLSFQPQRYPVHPEPIQLDLTRTDKLWSQSTIRSNFKGKAIYTVSPSANPPNAIDVSVIVSWQNGQNPEKRPIKMSTIITESGLNKWSQQE